MTEPTKIAMLFALPQEYGYLKRFTAPWLPKGREPFTTFVRRAPHQELILVESGMGGNRMLEAIQWLCGWTLPDLVIAGGFAGSLRQELRVGDVCLGVAFTSLDLPLDGEGNAWFRTELSERTIHFCHEQRIQKTHIVTVRRPKAKRLVSRNAEHAASIMDMESYFLARFCCRHHIPFLSIRAVSDGLEDEIDFDLETISDARGKVKIPLVLASIVRNPRLVRSYFHSWRRSHKAATNLGRALIALLHLPAAEFRSLIEEKRLCGSG
jgi:nucleoside phosphorylase